jgi:hypothetical protein
MVDTIHYANQLCLAPPSWTSSQVTEFPLRLDILYSYFVTGEDEKAFFLFSRFYKNDNKSYNINKKIKRITKIIM